MKYLRLFETHALYEAFLKTVDFLVPNVSRCRASNDVHYNPYTDPRLVATYNIEDATNPTLLYSYYAEEGDEEYWVLGVNLFDKIVIDETEVSVSDLDTAEGKYQLSAGEHTVVYTFKDPTSIGESAFAGCESLTSVTIPSSVTSIGESAFQNCSALTNITIPNTVTSIGERAFAGCESLTSVTIPSSVTSIGEYAFQNCSALTSVTIPSSVTSIGERAFAGCESLTNITIPNTVTSIGKGAFSNCSSLTSVTIGSGITNIGQGTFEGCRSLTSVTIPDSVTSIGAFPFRGCSSLTSVIIGSGVTNIGTESFRADSSLISVSVLAITPPTLGDFAFDENASGRKIYVPSESVAAYKAASGWSRYSSVIMAMS